MATKDVVQSIADYFKSEHWNRLIEVCRQKEEPIHHIHIYVETKINPICLEEIVKAYFQKIGHPVKRKIEIFTSGQLIGSGSIHGIEPEGMPHFDLIWNYSHDAYIKPAAKASNLEYWGRSYMEKFHGQYPFKTALDDREKREVEAYFSSKAWEDYCRLNEDPEVVHIHANVETSIHPDLIREYALEAMKKRGWEIDHATPVAFLMRGQMHGKIVFLGNRPEKIFDIAWAYNPTVTLIPSTKYWLTTENPTYDARTMHDLPLLLKRDRYEWLSYREMEAIVELL